MAIDSKNIKKLREITLAGMLDCKNALEESKGDMDKAVSILREKGIVKAVKKMDREVKEGRIFSYIHHNGKLGVLLELNCETDFVAKSDVFQELGKDISMHIAASSPDYISTEDVPKDLIQQEEELQKTLLQKEGKPDSAIPKILEGKIRKYMSEITLLEQPYVKEPKIIIKDIIKNCISKLGENIAVGKFMRYSI